MASSTDTHGGLSLSSRMPRNFRKNSMEVFDYLYCAGNLKVRVWTIIESDVHFNLEHCCKKKVGCHGP